MNKDKTCCTPPRALRTRAAAGAPDAPPARSSRDFETVEIPGGTALVGTKAPQIPDDGESPLRRKKLRPFRMSVTPVTNAQFSDFVAATGFVTEAERIGWSFVFWSDVPPDLGPTEAVPGTAWWRRVYGANWRAIDGPGTAVDGLDDHPVVQVSHHDALAYVAWVGGRLPTEAEWEHAARGGRGDVPFPWGTAEPDDSGFTPCNIWQGDFPTTNTARDGHARTAPVRAFEPNGYGLFQMVGNVWEWTSDRYRIRSLKTQVQARVDQMAGYRLSKGGSFLCHRSYCYRYRIAARSGTSPDSAAPHHGFRVVWSD